MIGDACWVLISASPDAPVVAEIWRRMTAGPRLDGLVAGFLQFGFEQLPDFALLIEAGDRYHALCRGDGSVALGVPAGGIARVNGAGLATWLDYPVPFDVSTIVLGDPPGETGFRLPAVAGIFLASGVIVDLASSPGGQGTSTGPLMTGPVLAGPVPPAPTPPAPPLPVPAPPAPAPPAPQAAVPQVPVPHGIAAREPAPDGDVPDDGAYDFLFAATQMRTVEDAAIRSEADEPLFSLAPPAPVASPGPQDAAEFAGPAPDGPPDAYPSGADHPRTSGWGQTGLIESVPWAIPERPSPAASGPQHPVGPSGTVPATPQPGLDAAFPPPYLARTPTVQVPPETASPDAVLIENTAKTIKRGDLPRAAPDSVVPDQIGPTVHALLCQRSHANPPSSVTCRICGEPLPPQDPVVVPRPVLGVLRLSTGGVISLDRGVVLGRNPRTEFDGNERLHAVKLPGGDGDISRTHLKVTLDGWHVLVTDLKSTNGTLVELPGCPPERLRPGDPFPIPNATVVTLAEDIYFRYEVT